MRYELGIIGAGNMAEAIVRGVLHARLFDAGQILLSDVSNARRDFFQQQLRVKATEDNAAVASSSHLLVLAVKPYQMQDVLGAIKPVLSTQTLVISIAAGISISRIQKLLGDAGHRIIRAMPNTPMLVGEGMVAISAGAAATGEDMAAARRIFEAAAVVVELPEDRMDAVTAMSGSGPAYFYYLVEYMIKAGLSLGLTADESALLAKRTAAGAAKILLAQTDTPEELRRRVTTPGGTTHAAISTMEERRVGDAIVLAIQRAAQRSREMGA